MFYRVLNPVHFYIMHLGIKEYWKGLKDKRTERQYRRLLQRHQQVLKGGITLSVFVTQTYTVKQFDERTLLVYLKFNINILHERSVATIGKALVPVGTDVLAGKLVCLKFLPGNLSQVVIAL